jgi:hypothetical protein
MDNGLLHYVLPNTEHLPEARQDPPGMTGRIDQCFEVMLLLHACRLIGRPDVAQSAAGFIGTHPKWYVDVDTGFQANSQYQDPWEFVPGYSAFSHNDLSEYGTVEQLLNYAQGQSITENPFDTIDPEITETLLF